MPVTTPRRLAGIRFEDATPPPANALPRMDIAVFAGFAARGPLHLPVAVEDPVRFTEIFGADLPLAWDPATSSPQYANLGPAVRAFFANGGLRCWIIRVAADSAETGSIPLAGVLGVAGDGALVPARTLARSPGSWSDGLVTTTALQVRGLSAGLALTALNARSFTTPGQPGPVRTGDLLRLTSFAGGYIGFVPVDSVSAPVPHLTQVNAAHPIVWLQDARHTPNPASGWTVRWHDGAAQAAVAATVTEWPAPGEDNLVTLQLTDAAAVAPTVGSWIQFSADAATPAESKFWIQVRRVGSGTVAGSPPGLAPRVEGPAWQFLSAPPTLASLGAVSIETVTLDLRVTDPGQPDFQLNELGFMTAHRRHWGSLPDDEAYFAAEPPPPERDRAWWREIGSPRCPLAGIASATRFSLPLAVTALGSDHLPTEHSGTGRLERDGLGDFSAALFLDAEMVEQGTAALCAHADFLRYQQTVPHRLRGIHAALAIDEATLLCVPDAGLRPWGTSTSSIAADPAQDSSPPARPEWWHHLPCDPPPASIPLVPAPPWSEFLPCDLQLIPAPQLSSLAIGTDQIELTWTSALADRFVFLVQEASRADFRDAVTLGTVGGRSLRLNGRAPAAYYYRIRALDGTATSNWSNGSRAIVNPVPRTEVVPPRVFESDSWLAVMRAAIRLCAARADLVLLASLPGHLRAQEALDLRQELGSARSRVLTVAGRTCTPLGAGESDAFSYAALFHPWLVIRDEAGVRLVPPEGAVAGHHARRALSRGAWIAAANEPVREAVALLPDIPPSWRERFLVAQLNLIRQEAAGFLCLSQDTLAGDELLRPLNVRRLLILMRRLALRHGAAYVFETNDAAFRRLVRHSFEALLGDLHRRGAFAGRTSRESFQVSCGDDVNPPESVDQGRFIVELRVAPSVPMTFVTIRLVQTSNRTQVTEIN
ncbi:MAG TPA: hypothetical protein VG734_16265 [Lacunisphaera sp.]|nr:hypothetical protein [Lacunisphaera sp.]